LLKREEREREKLRGLVFGNPMYNPFTVASLRKRNWLFPVGGPVSIFSFVRQVGSVSPDQFLF